MLALGTIIASSQCYDFSEQWVIAMVLGAHTASLYKVKKKKAACSSGKVAGCD